MKKYRIILVILFTMFCVLSCDEAKDPLTRQEESSHKQDMEKEKSQNELASYISDFYSKAISNPGDSIKLKKDNFSSRFKYPLKEEVLVERFFLMFDKQENVVHLFKEEVIEKQGASYLVLFLLISFVSKIISHLFYNKNKDLTVIFFAALSSVAIIIFSILSITLLSIWLVLLGFLASVVSLIGIVDVVSLVTYEKNLDKFSIILYIYIVIIIFLNIM